MRLVVVSNRLPITAVKEGAGFNFKASSGGLVTGLGSYLDSVLAEPRSKDAEYVWVGWPGIDGPEEMRAKMRQSLRESHGASPVFIPEDDMERFYHGFCNRTLWPLFHYFPGLTTYDESYWEEYKRVTLLYRDAVLETVKPGDIVWVHDYHLMLLPQMLREAGLKNPIGFFLHIPFPSFEIFRLLPMRWRREILEGLAGSDLIGFHTHDYAQYFLHSMLRILGAEHSFGRLLYNGRTIQVDSFPMGIDFKRFNAAASDPEIIHGKNEVRKTLGDVKTLLSIDRLDYSKGILNRLRGFEAFLKANPQWRKKVVLLLVLIPSRVQVDEYEKMKKQIDEFIGRINGEWGGLDWTPILYQYRPMGFNELVSFYAAGDAALVTPLRDGMNLIAKEYVASRADKTGMLILSEMAGASRELGEAIIINPTTAGEIADAIRTALEMPVEEQKTRNEILQARLKDYDVTRWAGDFLEKLASVRADQHTLKAKVLGESGAQIIVDDFRKASKRILFLDYDGTLAPYFVRPEHAAPSTELKSLLLTLAGLPKTEVVLISGRSRQTLESWFNGLNVHLIAEHGAWLRKRGRDWKWLKPLRNEWKAQLMPLLKAGADRLPGAFVEEKEYSLVWHYRGSDPEQARAREKELLDDLLQYTSNIDVQVHEGNKILEVRNAGISKGTAATEFIAGDAYDFILAIGDDTTDEDLFKALSPLAYSVRVGIFPTHARFNLPGIPDVIALLTALTSAELL